MNETLIMSIFHGIKKLLIDGGDLVQIRYAAPQITCQRTALNKGHNQVQQTLLITILNQLQDVRMMQSCYRASLANKATAHITICSVIPKNDLNRYASIESCALLSLIDSSHTSDTNASDDIVITKLSSFQSQHRLRLSFPGCLPYFPGTVLGEGRATGDDVVEVGVPDPGPPVGVGVPCTPGTFCTTIVI